MKKLNAERVMLVGLILGMIFNSIVMTNQYFKIKDLQKVVNSIEIPIEQKDGYFVEQVPKDFEVMEMEVIK